MILLHTLLHYYKFLINFFHLTSNLFFKFIFTGAKLEMRDSIGVTALQLAVEQGSADAICRLIEAGGDIRTKDEEGRTVLHRCAACK